MFDTLNVRDHPAIVVVKRAILFLLGTFLVIGILASYRAYVQVRSLDLYSTDSTIDAESVIRFVVVTSGRTPVDVQFELIQGTHSETVFTLNVPDNRYAFFDPRTQRASGKLPLSQELLARFQNGGAMIRASATGRPQWTRLPPPTIRELLIEIQR